MREMTKPEENASKNFIDELTKYLEENKLKEALSLFEDKNHESVIKESSWDIVPIVSSYPTIENVRHNEKLIRCCESILNSVAEICNPSETVLELLEQIEYQEDDVKFCTILKPLGISMNRMTDKTKAIEWCVSTIRSYIEGLPVPECEKQGGNETDVSGSINEVACRIRSVYVAVLSFLKPLIKEAALENDNKDNDILRDYLASVLIFLLGKPLCYLPEQELKLSDSKQSLSEEIIISISCITGDLLWYLTIVHMRSERMNSKKKDNIEDEHYNPQVALFESIENVPNLSYANFYFYVLSTTQFWEKAPQVYHPLYILQAGIYLVNDLFQHQETVIIAKGSNLMEHILKRIERRSLTPEILELNIYFELFNTITKVMIYCGNDKERKKALHVFREYIELYNMHARYYIIQRLYKISEHSGLLSLITGILKESIIECLQTTPPTSYFLGNNLETLLKQACTLPHGSASDLVEISDEIITSLNLLRFLLIRDQNNVTGIWNIVDKLEKDYLKPLREGINLCKTHWKVKIKDLEEQKKNNVKKLDDIELENNDMEVTLTVGGEKLPPMPINQKILFCYQAVNGLDVMESILCRLNECIANNPLHQSADKTVSSN